MHCDPPQSAHDGQSEHSASISLPSPSDTSFVAGNSRPQTGDKTGPVGLQETAIIEEAGPVGKTAIGEESVNDPGAAAPQKPSSPGEKPSSPGTAEGAKAGGGAVAGGASPPQPPAQWRTLFIMTCMMATLIVQLQSELQLELL